MASDGTSIWVANYGDNTVTKLRADGVVLGTVNVGSGPIGMTFDGANVWVANSGSNMVTVPGCPDLTRGNGTPTVEFSSVPPRGSNSNLIGNVLHATTADHRLVVYIHVDGGWWVKPFANAPLTNISCDGPWSANIVTGGNDAQADQIVAS